MCDPCLFPSKKLQDLTVYLGRDTLRDSNPNMVTLNVSKIILHPGYDRLFRDDIALLQLSSTVTFTDYIRPACLAASGSRFDGTEGWVTGFGRTSTHSRTRAAHFYILTDKLSQNFPRIFGSVQLSHCVARSTCVRIVSILIGAF